MIAGARRVVLLALVVSVGIAVVPPGALAASNDPYRPAQWHLDRLGIDAAWERTRGAGQVIAIVDTGVDATHPDLTTQLLREDGEVVGWDFVDDDPEPEDASGHGTMVAGIAAAATDNGLGVAGVAPEARIMPLRVLDEDGSGRSRDVDAAIRWAVDHGADVINLSLESVVGARTADGRGRVEAPVAAVRYAWERGVVVVAAAGNDASDFDDYPLDAPVLVVGASDRQGRHAGFSDVGRDDAVVAPGVEIISTWCRPVPEGGCDAAIRYGEADGTSFAAPQVSGLLALLMAAGLGSEQAVARVRETAVDLGRPGTDPVNGYGRVDAARALGEPEPDDPSTREAERDPSRDGTREPGEPAPAELPETAAPPEPAPPPRNPVRGVILGLLAVAVVAAVTVVRWLGQRVS